MYHDAPLPRTRLTLATLAAALTCTTFAHASETHGTDQPAAENISKIEAEPGSATRAGETTGSHNPAREEKSGAHKEPHNVLAPEATRAFHIGSEPSGALTTVNGKRTPWRPPRWRRIFIGSLLGSGIGLFATGATLVGIHDSPPRRRCRAYVSELDCPLRYRTNVAGGILAGVGFVNIITAAVFAIYTNQHYRRMRNRSVQFRPTPNRLTIAF